MTMEKDFATKRTEALEFWRGMSVSNRKLLVKLYYPNADFLLIDSSSSKIQELYQKIMDSNKVKEKEKPSLTDKDIRFAMDEAYKAAKENAYFGNGFWAGVEFMAERFGIEVMVTKN